MNSAAGAGPPQYEVLEELSRGGMGVVSRARHRQLDREVALKVILEASPSPELLARFEKEARALAALEHPNIVRLYEFGSWQGRQYMAMELIRGRSLKREVEDSLRRLKEVPPPSWSLAALRPIAEALRHCHKAGLIHRDLKPENIVIEEGSGRPVLIDFGLVFQEDHEERLSRTGEALGTPGFMAPEQLEGKAVAITDRADVWAFGATLLYALTGRAPYEGKTFINIYKAMLSADPPRARALNGAVPAALDELCAACLRRASDERPGLDEVLAHLDEALADPASPPTRSSALLAISALVALLAGLGLGGLALALRPAAPPPPPPPAPAAPAPRPAPPPPLELRVGPDGAADFTSLGAALAALPDGGTIKVLPGLYREDLALARPASLLGVGERGAVVIEGALAISAPEARLRGLTLKARPGGGPALRVTAGAALIEGCEVLGAEGGAGLGIQILGAKAAPILRDLRVSGHGVCGLLVAEGARALIEDCALVRNHLGLEVVGPGTEARLAGGSCEENVRAGAFFRAQARGVIEAVRFRRTRFSHLVVEASRVELRGGSASDGRSHGLCLRQGASLSANELSVEGNADPGIWVRDSSVFSGRGLTVRGNGSIGLLVEKPGRAEVADSIFDRNKRANHEAEPGAAVTLTRVEER